MAGLIPEHFIQDLLARTDLVELVRSRVPLKKSGRNWVACCPFHQEKSPSFSVAPDKQFYHCFGCGCTGDAIRFLMDYDHMEFPQAVEMLAGLAGMEVPHETEKPGAREERSRQQQMHDLLTRASDFFRNQLSTSPDRQKPLRYIAERGLNKEVSERYHIGYAPPGYDNLATGLGLDAIQQELALTTGLLIDSEDGKRRYDRFRDRLMFPIRDSRGRTIGFGGRILGDGKPKYLNSPETPVFHKGQELYGLWEWRETREASKFLLVVEGYLDVISLAQFGIHNAVATLGTSTTEQHMQKLFREVDEVVFCFDGDKAGRSAAWRALNSALGELTDDKQVRFLFLPDGEDPDTLVRKQGPEAIRAACAGALSLEDFLFTHLAEGLDLGQIAGHANLAKQALPLIGRIKGSFYRNLLEQALAKRTGIAVDELARLKATRPPNDSAPATPAIADHKPHRPGPLRQPAPDHRILSLAERLLLVLLAHPSLAISQPLPADLDALELPHLDLLHRAVGLLQQQPASTRAMAMGILLSLPEGETIARLARIKTPATTDDLARKEWQDGLLQLRLSRVELQIRTLQQDRHCDPARLAELLQQRHALQQQCRGRQPGKD